MDNHSKPTTEQSSRYSDLEKMSTGDLLRNINREDKTVPEIIEKEIPAIEKLVDVIVEQIKKGGRLFYIGAGTSGRLGVLDASECPPTFGVSDNVVIGLIAGGDVALRKAVENAEDDATKAWQDLLKFNINDVDVLIGIAASGTTPYVIGGRVKNPDLKTISRGLGIIEISEGSIFKISSPGISSMPLHELIKITLITRER